MESERGGVPNQNLQVLEVPQTSEIHGKFIQSIVDCYSGDPFVKKVLAKPKSYARLRVINGVIYKTSKDEFGQALYILSLPGCPANGVS